MDDRRDFSVSSLRELHRLALEDYQDLPSLYQSYLRTGCELLGVSVGIVSRIQDQQYTVLAVEDEARTIQVGDVFTLGDTYCSTVIKKQGSVALHHVGALEEMRSHPVYQGMALESYIAAPIQVAGQVFGTLNFSDSAIRAYPFTIEEIEFLELMAQAIGQAVERDNLRRQREKAIVEMEHSVALFEGAFRFAAIGMAIVSPEGRWLRVNKALCKLVGYSEEALLEIDFQTITHPEDLDTDMEFVNALLQGKKNSYWMKKRYFHKEGHIVWVLLAVSIVRNRDGSPRYFLSQIEDITAQVRAETELKEQRDELAQLNQELADLARTDPLTGLNNRMVLMEFLRQAHSASLRSCEPLSAVSMDVDYFKEFNDEYGHREGDVALQAVAEALQGVTRGSDMLARYGGEEFVALLPGAGINQARAVADRFRTAVSDINDLPREIHLSVGVATLVPETGTEPPDADDLLGAADQALYAAKEQGRNCVRAVAL